MTRTERVLDVVSLAVLGGLVAFTASVYGDLPARVATHFDLSGKPNDWMDRAYATWGLDVFALGLWAFVRFAPRLLPEANEWRKRASASPIAAMALLTMLLMVGVSVFIVWTALHPERSWIATLEVMMGLFALALSSILPRTRRNPLFGIRTPFSLTSDENWLRTNRFGSYAAAAGGLGCIVFGLANAPALGIAAFVAGLLAPLAYSWVLAYRLPPES